MEWARMHALLVIIQHCISFIGILIIFTGVIVALCQYVRCFFKNASINTSAIRLSLGRILILGLEFIVAADLIGTTTAPDYYTVGILACIVAIRTVLTYSLSKEMNALANEPA